MKHFTLIILFLQGGCLSGQPVPFDTLAKKSDLLVTGIVISNLPKQKMKDDGTWEGMCRLVVLRMDHINHDYSLPPCGFVNADTITLEYITYDHKHTPSSMIGSGQTLSFLLRVEPDCPIEYTELVDKSEAVFQFSPKKLEEFDWRGYYWMNDKGTIEPNKRFMHTSDEKVFSIQHAKNNQSIYRGRRRRLIIGINVGIYSVYDERGTLRSESRIYRNKRLKVIKIFDASGHRISKEFKRFPRIHF
jgi:hypothetical protein